MKVCTFTGHRPQKFPWKFNENDKRCRKLKSELNKAILRAIAEGYDYFITGGALGVDMWAAETVLAYKNIYGLQLEIAQPFAGFNDNLSGDYGQRQRYLLEHADKITIVSQNSSERDAYKLRNQYMIDQSSRLIAALDDIQSYSGTAQTLRMAQKANLEIIRLDWAQDEAVQEEIN